MQIGQATGILGIIVKNQRQNMYLFIYLFLY